MSKGKPINGSNEPTADHTRWSGARHEVKDRIVELRRVKASDLSPHPQNWRDHPNEQRSELRSVLSKIGYADAIKVRQYKDGYQILDGHLRAESTPDMEVPVLVLDLDDQETKEMLATFDPIGAMAKTNQEKLDELLGDTDLDCLQRVEEAVLHDGSKQHDDWGKNIIRQIMLTLSQEEYPIVTKALADLCEKRNLNNFTEVVFSLLEDAGYEIPSPEAT